MAFDGNADSNVSGRRLRRVGRQARRPGTAEGVAQRVDGLALEVESYVGVDASGDADGGRGRGVP